MYVKPLVMICAKLKKDLDREFDSKPLRFTSTSGFRLIIKSLISDESEWLAYEAIDTSPFNYLWSKYQDYIETATGKFFKIFSFLFKDY